MGDADRKFFVLDTNILLHEPFAIYSFQEHDVVIPMTVLEELDRIKDSKRDVAPRCPCGDPRAGRYL